jgi:hypothetical protein
MAARKKMDLATALHSASGKAQPASAAPPEEPKLAPKPIANKPSATMQAVSSIVAPSRKGKKAITGFFDPAVSRELKQIGLNQDVTVQALLTEAINDLLVKYGRSPIA